jgi:gas vesicle protein
MKLGRYIVGLISGLTFGMLFAPKKGKDLRRDIIKKGSSSGQEGLKTLGGAFMDAGEEVLSELKNLSENEQVAAMLEMSKEKLGEYLSFIEGRGYDVAGIAQKKLEEIAVFATDKARQLEKRAAEKENDFVKKAVKKPAFTNKKVSKKAAK